MIGKEFGDKIREVLARKLKGMTEGWNLSALDFRILREEQLGVGENVDTGQFYSPIHDV